MSTTLGTHLLFQEPPVATDEAPVPDTVRSELRRIAFASDSLPEISRVLYLRLRELLGSTAWGDWLVALQMLARCNEPAGARLLAALLNVNVPGRRLLPPVAGLPNSRRMRPLMQMGAWLDHECWDWELRLHDLHERCLDLAPRKGPESRWSLTAGGKCSPFDRLARRLAGLAARITTGARCAPADRSLLADLLHLEVDAYRERLVRLASRLDPFRRRTVWRILPLLNRADAEIRDLVRLIADIEEDRLDAAFRRPRPRYSEIMDRRKCRRFRQELAASPRLLFLAEMFERQLERPLPLEALSAGAARLMALVHQLHLLGRCDGELDLLRAVRVVLCHGSETGLRLPLDPQLEESVRQVRLAPGQAGPWCEFPLDNVELTSGVLHIRWPRLGLAEKVWPHHLPVPVDPAGGQLEPATDVRLGAQDSEPAGDDVRRLVLENIESESFLIGLLRNPRVVATPGLVGSVVVRSRSLRILEMIAVDRSLYAGFANQEVPLALLRSPVNVPLKTLRKFIHVKYVSRIDLQTLVRHEAALRRDVVDEVARYLDSFRS